MIYGETIVRDVRLERAQAIVSSLPAPDYATNYQPTYPSRDRVVEAVGELLATKMATTPRDVDALQASLTEVAIGERNAPVILDGRCAEPIILGIPIRALADHALSSRGIVHATYGSGAVHITRNKGQKGKPRTSAVDVLPDGTEVPSYMGDLINGKGLDQRTPDPSRMVAGALQARDLGQMLITDLGIHTPSAHEALLLPYEKAGIRIDPETNQPYLLTADMPWVGKRTNRLESAHVALLSGLANPIGVKIGADSTAGHIKGLRDRLNPRGIPGKLTFMLRMGQGEEEQLAHVAEAIATHAPESLNMYDIHGVTRTVTKEGKTYKIRAVPEIIDAIGVTASILGEAGLRLHGLHVETIGDDSRYECVDSRRSDDLPTHEGGVDPQLTPRQLADVLTQTQHHLLQTR